MAKKKLTHQEAEAKIVKVARAAGIEGNFSDGEDPMSIVVQGFRDARKRQKEIDAKEK